MVSCVCCTKMRSDLQYYVNSLLVHIFLINREWKMKHPVTNKPKPRGTPLSIRGTKVMKRYCHAPITNACTVNSPLTDTLVSGQLYFQTLCSIPHFTFQSNSVFAHSLTRTLLKIKIGFFFVYILSSGHPTYMYNN